MAPERTSSANAERETLSFATLKSLVSGLSVWFLFLFSGGVVFAVYYARIEYLPDIEWNSALSYLAAASMIGGGLLITLSLFLIAPGLIWTTQLTRGDTLKKAFCSDSQHATLDLRKLLTGLVVWLFLFSALTHGFLIYHYRWFLVGLGIVVLVQCVYIRFFELKDVAAGKRNEQFAVYGFWYIVSLADVTAATYILFTWLGLSSATYPKTHLVICTLGLVIANFVVTLFLHQKERGKAFAAAVMFALAIIITGDYFDPVPEKILAKYGFGLQPVQIIVSEDGYKVLALEGLAPSDSSTGPKAISNVSILCRMGQNYFLQIGNRKVTLRKSDVVSWSVQN
jgi:hypothetical protein